MRERLDRSTFTPLGWSWQGEFHLFKEDDMGNGFAFALGALKNGKKVTREGWNGKGQFVALQVPDEGSKMTLPYLYISTVTGDLVPWLASQTDLLADDWRVVLDD
jgi:hypothetical protein